MLPGSSGQYLAWGAKKSFGAAAAPPVNAARPTEHCSTARQAGVINKQAHGKHIDFPELIAQQPVLSYQATLICNLLRERRVGLRLAAIFTVGWTGRWKV